MNENLVETIALDNGQNLEIYNISKNIVSDIWLISVVFKIIIKIDDKLLKINKNTIDYKTIQNKLGKEVVYEVKHERNFIKKDKKDIIFNDIKRSFLNTNIKYLSHNEFAEKYVLKKFSNLKCTFF